MTRFRFCPILVRHFSSVAENLPIKLEHLNNSKIGLITLQKAETRNAMSRNMIAMFDEYIEQLSHEKALTCLIIQSGIKGAFCSGADLKERAKMAPHEVGPFVSKIRGLIMKLYHFPTPTIAAIDGVALGGGLELALSCDMRVASSTSKIGLVETKLGIIPGGGGTQTLSRIIGVAKAKELIFTGRILSGTEAEEMGIVNDLVKTDDPNCTEEFQVNKRALALAEQISEQGPIALRMAKHAINVGSEIPVEPAMSVEKSCYAQVIHTKDRLEGLQAFKEKRKPVFKGE